MFAFGTIGQFHNPKVWVDKTDGPAALELIGVFEAKKTAEPSPEDAVADLLSIDLRRLR